MSALTRRTGVSRYKRVKRGVPSSPSTRPKVAAVVTAFNYDRYLWECVQSALCQDGVDVEVVLVDDYSTDETPRVTARLSRDPRVKVIRNEQNLGLIGSFNTGLGRVAGEYMVKLDADDVVPPGSWARSAALLERHPEVTFVYGRPYHFSGPVPDVRGHGTRSWTIWSGHDWVAGRCRSGVSAISQPEVMMRTKALREVGGLCPEGPIVTSDMHLWLRLAAIGEVGRINGPVQGLYRVHDKSMLRSASAGILNDLVGRRDAFDGAFASTAGALADAQELHELARRSLAVCALDRACRAYERGRTRDEPVDDLVAFATATYPRARELKEWVALERRRAVGSERAHRRPRFIASAVARRTAEEIGHRLWLRTGEW